MEEWQASLIRENLNRLMDSTKCSPALLAFLHSERIISEDEVQRLLLPTKINSEKSLDLYDILKTRTGAFNAIKRGLQQTQQSGALLILSQYHLNDDDEETESSSTPLISSACDIERQRKNTETVLQIEENADLSVKVPNEDSGKLFQTIKTDNFRYELIFNAIVGVELFWLVPITIIGLFINTMYYLIDVLEYKFNEITYDQIMTLLFSGIYILIAVFKMYGAYNLFEYLHAGADPPKANRMIRTYQLSSVLFFLYNAICLQLLDLSFWVWLFILLMLCLCC